MLTAYIKLAYRNLLKNKVSSIINIFGLSIAIGCSIVVYLIVYSNFSKNAFHEHGKQIFLVEQVRNHNGETQVWAETPVLFAPALTADFPQITRAVRVADRGGTVYHMGNKIQESIRFVDDGFLDMFTYPLKYGNANGITNPGAVILSEKTAGKYFGADNPIGRTMTISLGEADRRSFVVEGVAEAFPTNDGLGFQFLINYDNRPDRASDRPENWADLTRATFIQVENPEDIEVIATRMDRYLSRQNAVTKEQTVTAFICVNLLDLQWNAANVRGSIVEEVPWTAIVIFSCFAFFLLSLSCLNYINIALSTATRRLKEIAIRKAVGSYQSQLIVQFITENICLCLLSLGLGIILADAFFIPVFNSLGSNLVLPYGESIGLWAFLIVLLVVIGIASGSYPAFYISSFQPTVIFSGMQKMGSRTVLMQSLLTLQFVLAGITTISSIGLTLNEMYQANLDWGYNQKDILVVRLEDGSQFDIMRNEVMQLPDVISIAGTRDHLEGGGELVSTVEIAGKAMESVRFDIGPTYFETMGFRLIEGELSDIPKETDTVVINEAFARRQAWSDPIEKKLQLDGKIYTVSGVIENFHYDSFFEPIEPVLFCPTEVSNFRFLVTRFRTGTDEKTASDMEKAWNRISPGTPFEGFYQNTVFDRFYQTNRDLVKIFTFTAAVALLISCMGLFGLLSQNIAGRMKEICVHKILGASDIYATILISRRFLMLVGIAVLIATPVSYFLLNALLKVIYSYHMGLGFTPFLIAYALVFAATTLSVLTQFRTLVAANPSEVLRLSN